MQFRYSNNGQCFDRVANTYQAEAGEAVFADPPSAAQLGAAFPGYAAAETAASQAAAAQPLKDQLAALDAFLPRGLEDYFTATGFDVTKLPEVQQQRLQAKQQLRTSLDAAMKPSGS